MDSALDDSFVVFVRGARDLGQAPEDVERPLVSCPTYAEARWVRQEYQAPGRECIIRYVGPAGGGD
jgi:hypothetical protein